MSSAVFFDFDGVILESSDIKTEAFVTLFESMPEHLEAIKNHHLSNMGISRFEKFAWIYRELLNKKLTDEESRRLGDEFSRIVYNKVLQAPFVHGALELLQSLKGKKSLFIASGTPEAELQKIVEERNLAPYFYEVLGAPKSKTEIVNSMIAKYELNRSECWFIGDASTDFEAATQTSIKFIGRSVPETEAYWKRKKVLFFEDLRPLLQLIK